MYKNTYNIVNINTKNGCLITKNGNKQTQNFSQDLLIPYY